MFSISTSTSGFMRYQQKSNDSSAKTRMPAANCCCPCCDNSRYRRRRAPCIFMNVRCGALLHRPRPGQPASTRPVPKLLWAHLLLLGLLCRSSTTNACSWCWAGNELRPCRVGPLPSRFSHGYCLLTDEHGYRQLAHGCCAAELERQSNPSPLELNPTC